MPTLSKPARDLPRQRSSGRKVEVTPENIGAYRELARAGVMDPVSTFIDGLESLVRFTMKGWERLDER
jgi:hypothetical protein